MAESGNSDGGNDLRIVGPVAPLNEDNDAVQPRQPRNLQDVLRYSVEAGSSPHSNTNHANLQTLDAERRRFLEGALSSMTVDVIQELKDSMATLSPLSSSSNEIENCDDLPSYEIALTNISELVENIDVANDFLKLGGLKLMNDCLVASYSSIRWESANVIAICAQNNPTFQKSAIQENVLPKLICMVDMDPDDKCKIKALYALSCIIRDSEDGLTEFINQDGFSLIVRALQSHTETLRTKSAFLISSLTSQNSKIKETLCQIGFVEQLVGLIQGEHSKTHEHLLSALLSIITDNEAAISECQRPELKLRNRLESLLEDLKDNEAYLEEVDYIHQVLRTVFTGDPEGER